jgi:hypothetical protein
MSSPASNGSVHTFVSASRALLAWRVHMPGNSSSGDHAMSNEVIPSTTFTQTTSTGRKQRLAGLRGQPGGAAVGLAVTVDSRTPAVLSGQPGTVD